MDDDDEFDQLLAQIDETQFMSEIGEKIIDKPPNLSTTEEAFFSPQTDSLARPPVKRRFPGPAGLIPVDSPLCKDELLPVIDLPSQPLYHKVPRPVSKYVSPADMTPKIKVQQSGGRQLLLSRAPWKKMITSLGLRTNGERGLLKSFNIKWLRDNVQKIPAGMRIPFIVAVVQGKLEVSSFVKKLRSKNPSVRLMDPTGATNAAFSPQFLSTYGDRILPGTAIALRNCRVITLKKHAFLSIGKQNLAYLASTLEEESTDQDDEMEQPVTSAENHPDEMQRVSEIVNCPLDLNKISQEFEQLVLNLKTTDNSDQPESAIECHSDDILYSSVFDDDDDDEFSTVIQNVS